MGIVTFAVICLILGATFALVEGREQVTVIDSQIPEFLIDCHKTTWIYPCYHHRRYLMIFDSQGNFFQEMTSEINNMPYRYLGTSFTQKAKKPTKDDVKQGVRPDYLIEMEKVDQHSESFYIATKSGHLLVAGTEVSNPSLHLREDRCSKLYNGTKLIGSSGSSTTESSVAVHDWLMSQVTPTTAVSTQSPIAHLISRLSKSLTSAPKLDYNCTQAQWKLWKEHGRFLLIESVSNPKFYLNAGSGTHMVKLGAEEKMTGIKTSFLNNVTLERSDGQAEPGIQNDAYGDLVIHYFGRNGSQQSGYVCSYDWGQESANALCTYLKGLPMGIPTFDGRYSSTITPQYAVSALQCKDENIDKCEFRTVCGSDHSCLAQNSMKAFGGTGYACDRGSYTDVAGVICGNSTEINNVLKEKITCNSNSSDKDRKSVQDMFTIQKQIMTVKPSMFQNKHWSQYLLPMPMAISLMSALLLVSAQNDRTIRLVRPINGQWDHLRFDYLDSNLVDLSLNIQDNFLLSSTNMGEIKQNTLTIHKDLKLALQYAFSSNEYDYTTGLTRKLDSIEENAEANKEMANQVNSKFNNTGNIIKELIAGLQNTKDFQTEKKQEVVDALQQLNQTFVLDKVRLEKNMKEKEDYEAKVDKSRKAFYDAAKKAMNAKCVNENQECNICEWKEPQKTEICLKAEKVCSRWKSVCVSIDEDFWSDDDCDGWEQQCSEYSPMCLEYYYKPAGSYCQDRGLGGLCTKCSWANEVSKSLAKVAHTTYKLQNSVINGDTSYSALTDVIGDLVSQVGEIDQNVQKFKKWEDASKIAPPKYNESQSSNLEQNTSANLNSTLKPLHLIKLSVEMSINLLKQDKIPIAIRARNYGLEVKSLLENLITRQVQKVGHMTEEDKILITTLHTTGKSILNEAIKVEEKHEVSIKNDMPSEAIADVRTGDLATKHLEYLSERYKVKKNIESLTNRMRNGIEEMFKQDFEVQDLNSILNKLIQCSKYLKLLNEQWIILQDFFSKLSMFLQRLKSNMLNMVKLYNQLGVEVDRDSLAVAFKTDLRDGVLENIVNNIYVMRVAVYYTKILDDGLLQRVASMTGYSEKIEDPILFNNTKMYLKGTATNIQEKIISEVAKEEAKINDQLMKEIYSIENQLACIFQNSGNPTESSEAGRQHGRIIKGKKKKEQEKNQAKKKECTLEEFVNDFLGTICN